MHITNVQHWWMIINFFYLWRSFKIKLMSWTKLTSQLFIDCFRENSIELASVLLLHNIRFEKHNQIKQLHMAASHLRILIFWNGAVWICVLSMKLTYGTNSWLILLPFKVRKVVKTLAPRKCRFSITFIHLLKVKIT